MASRLACDRADVVAAIAPVSGTLGAGTRCTPSRPVSVLEIHGTSDRVVPYAGGGMVGRGGPSDIEPAETRPSALLPSLRIIDAVAWASPEVQVVHAALHISHVNVE